MKYVIVLGDGMSGEPVEALGGKTCLEAACIPAMDQLASLGEVWLVQNVPSGMAPGSDVANLSVLGYDPAAYYTGRSPLEALSIGIPMEEDDVVFRCNLVTLTEEEPYEKKTILDHSASEISTGDADVLMDAVRDRFNSERFQFYTGTSYRHILVWKHGKSTHLEPPHDHLTKVIGPYLPREIVLRDMMEKSFSLLNNHPLNLQRAAQGKHKGNSLWFWGPGTRPSLPSFRERTGLKGAMISAVDLLKGMAAGAGMEVMEIPGATGSIDTNWEGKAQAAIEALLHRGCDLAYIHLEAPDEMAHQGLPEEKVRSIEYLDHRIIAPVKEALDTAGEGYRMLILPDHPNPVKLRTHTAQPVPYIFYDSTQTKQSHAQYTEAYAASTGIVEANGYRLLGRFLG